MPSSARIPVTSSASGSEDERRSSSRTGITQGSQHRNQIFQKILVIDAGGCLVQLMGHSKGKDNVKKRAARRKKMERLKAAKAK
jgi:hypothetical protein